MCNSIRSKILSRIYGHGGGWIFSSHDFIGDFRRYEIDQTLSSLAKAGDIRRILRGIYDYPKTSPRLGRLSPDADAVAAAIARKDGRVVEVSPARAAKGRSAARISAAV